MELFLCETGYSDNYLNSMEYVNIKMYLYFFILKVQPHRLNLHRCTDLKQNIYPVYCDACLCNM